MKVLYQLQICFSPKMRCNFFIKTILKNRCIAFAYGTIFLRSIDEKGQVDWTKTYWQLVLANASKN